MDCDSSPNNTVEDPDAQRLATLLYYEPQFDGSRKYNPSLENNKKEFLQDI